MSKESDRIIEGTGKLVDTIPTIYEDALKPATQETGKTVALIPRAINAALVPLRKWIAEREYSLAETEKLLAKKLETVDEEKIVTPDAYVAVPALQAISYSMDSKELRNLYANLLAKAMNIDEKDKVHPAFVEIIKQLTPKEAIILNRIMDSMITPVLDLSFRVNSGGNRLHKYNFTWLIEFSYEEVALAVDNLQRMGLIEIPYGESYTDDKNYDSVRKNVDYIEYKKILETKTNGTVDETKKYIKKTALANSFYEVCIKE